VTVSLESPALEAVLKRDRVVVIAGLIAVSTVSWFYTLAGAGLEMDAMPGDMVMAMRPQWTLGYAALMLAMWWVMMVAMMLPSAAPMVLLFAAIIRKGRSRGEVHVSTGKFVAGYVVVWGGFSLGAVMVQWGLENLGLFTPMMATTSVALGGLLLISAGIYQLTPLKDACLRHCRSPVEFMAVHWRPGGAGAFAMGLTHGVFCLGCCWVLMGLLFYGGVMNPWWIAGLAIYVLIEKLAPAGPRIGRFTGALLILWGLWLLWLLMVVPVATIG
jgi:predicted metal-binding membrane protein